MKSLKSFADFLLDLERCSDGRSPDIFQQSAFECLGQCLDFDSGVWASGALTSTGPDFHSVALWRQPAQMLLDYEALKAEDPLFGGRTRASHPGLAAMPAGPAAEHGRPRPSLPAWPAACRHAALARSDAPAVSWLVRSGFSGFAAGGHARADGADAHRAGACGRAMEAW